MVRALLHRLFGGSGSARNATVRGDLALDDWTPPPAAAPRDWASWLAADDGPTGAAEIWRERSVSPAASFPAERPVTDDHLSCLTAEEREIVEQQLRVAAGRDARPRSPRRATPPPLPILTDDVARPAASPVPARPVEANELVRRHATSLTEEEKRILGQQLTPRTAV